MAISLLLGLNDEYVRLGFDMDPQTSVTFVAPPCPQAHLNQKASPGQPRPAFGSCIGAFKRSLLSSGVLDGLRSSWYFCWYLSHQS